MNHCLVCNLACCRRIAEEGRQLLPGPVRAISLPGKYTNPEPKCEPPDALLTMPGMLLAMVSQEHEWTGIVI